MYKIVKKIGVTCLAGILLFTQNNIVFANDEKKMVSQDSKNKEQRETTNIEKSSVLSVLNINATLGSEKGEITLGNGVKAVLNGGKTYTLDISAGFTNDTTTDKSIEMTIPEGFKVVKYPTIKNISEYPNLQPFFKESSAVMGNKIYELYNAEEGKFTINLKPTTTAVNIPITVEVDSRFFRTTLGQDIVVSVIEGTNQETVKGNIQCNDKISADIYKFPDSNEDASVDQWTNEDIYGLDINRKNESGKFVEEQILFDEITKEFIAPTGSQFKTEKDYEVITTENLGNGTTKFIVTRKAFKGGYLATSGCWKFPSSLFKVGDKAEVIYKKATYKLHGNPVQEVTSGNKVIYTMKESYEEVRAYSYEKEVSWVRKSMPDNEAELFSYGIENRGIMDSAEKEIVMKFEKTDIAAVTGFEMPRGNLDAAGKQFIVNEILFKTTKSNEWKTINGKFESRVNREDLGITDKDEYLTDVKFSIGQIPKGASLSGGKYFNTLLVYGKVFKNPTDHPDLFGDKNVTMKSKASVEVKNEGGNKSTGQIEMSAILMNTKFDVFMSIVGSTSKVAGDIMRLEYNSVSSSDAVNRPNVYLRSEGKLVFSNFKIVRNEKDITKQCLVTLDHTENDGTYVYKISMKNVTGDDGIVGKYKGQNHTLNVSFDVESSKDFSGGTWDLNNLIFLEDTEDLKKWYDGFNSDPFDVNRNGKTDDQNINFFNPTPNNETYTIIPRKTFFSDISAKDTSEQDKEYRNYNNGNVTNIINVKDQAKVKVDLYNKGAQSAKEAIVYLPVPKVGKNYGSLFQRDDFNWSMKLDALLDSTDDYEISYASIATIPNGGITTAQLEGYDYKVKSDWDKSLSDINMIRIKTKREVPSNKVVSFVFEFSKENTSTTKLSKATALNVFHVYQYFDLTGMAEGSSGYRNGDIIAFQIEKMAEHTVNFETNGGSSIDAIQTKNGEKIEKPTDPTKSGYKFEGWYKDVSMTKKWDFASDVVESEMTLYAKWSVVEKPIVPVEPGKPEEPSNPIKPEQPQEPSNPIKPEQPQEPMKPIKPSQPIISEIETSDIPKTEDSAITTFYMYMLLLASGVLGTLVIIKRRKQKE